MPVSTTYTGASWEALRVSMVYAFDAANGNTSIGGIVYPRLTNAQAIAIMTAWRGQLVAWKQPAAAWSQWSGAWYGALGYRDEGDRFDVTLAHGAETAPDHVIADTWEAAARAASLLDAAGATPTLIVLNLSYQGWRDAASLAWSQLQKERAKKKPAPHKVPVPMPPGIDPPEVDPPTPPTPPLPIVPSPDGGALLLVALLALALVARRRKKN